MGWPGSIAPATAGIPSDTTTSVPLQLTGEDIGRPITPELESIDNLIREGHYLQAETAAREALTKLEASGQDESLEAAGYADRLVEALLQGEKGSRQETLARAELAVRLNEQLSGPNSFEAARSVERLGRVLTRRTEFMEAQQVLQRALDLAGSGGGSTEGLDRATVQQSVGDLLRQQGEFEQARAVLEEVLAAREKLLGPDDPAVAETLRVLGECLTQHYETQAAIDLFDRSQRIYLQSAGADHPHLASTLTALAEALEQTDEFGLARAHLERAIEIFEGSNGPDTPLLAEPLISLAALLRRTGDFAGSRTLVDRALQIGEHEFGPMDPVTAEALRTLGLLRMSLGDFSAAADQFAEVVVRLQTRLGPSHWRVARAIENQGVALAQAEKYAEAELLLLQALEIFVQALGPNNPRVAQPHLNLVPICEGLGELTKAQQHGLRGLEILDNAGNPSLVKRGKLLANLGHITRRLGDLAGALLLAEQAESALRQAYGPFHPDVAKAMLNRAVLLYSSGQYDQAQALALEAEATSREHLVSVLRSATEHEALTLAAVRFSAINCLIFMALNHPEDQFRIVPAAWDSVIRARALILDEMMSRQRTRLISENAETSVIERELQLATERLAKLVVQGPGTEGLEGFGASLREAREAKARAQREYAGRSEKFRQTQARNSAGLSEISASLPPGIALVAFVSFDYWPLAEPGSVSVPIIGDPTREYAAFLLHSPSEQPELVRLGSSVEIDTLIAKWHRSGMSAAFAAGRVSKSGDTEYREVAKQLRRAVWDPIAPYLADAERVLIVPDGALTLLNLAALPVGENQYLVESGPRFHYLSSERDLLLDDPLVGSGALLAVGAPDFDSPEQYAASRKEPMRVAPTGTAATDAIYRGPRSACGSFQEMAFEPLPAAGQEVEEIVGLWRQAVDGEADSVLTGIAASETAFKQSASGKRVLHLATHGFFLGGDCGSALDPLEGDNVTNENPLLLSGLVLAGANHRSAVGPDEDDGILTAEEIATLDLGDSKWAVLSACDTGRGEVRAGEGVFGLQRAFRIAGARTTIMSLWSVEDKVTRQWMKSLYRHHFLEGKSTMDSVHSASLELLQQRREQGLSTHPYYWAGFVASGDWR